MSVRSRQDRTHKFARCVLLDRTKSGPIFFPSTYLPRLSIQLRKGSWFYCSEIVVKWPTKSFVTFECVQTIPRYNNPSTIRNFSHDLNKTREKRHFLICSRSKRRRNSLLLYSTFVQRSKVLGDYIVGQ